MKLPNLIKKLFRTKQHYFWQDKLIFFPSIISIILNFFIWLFLIIRVKSLNQIIPLHYNIYYGVDFIGPKTELFKINLLALLILFINLFLAFKIYKYERINSYFLLFASLLSQLIFLIFFISIVNL